MIECFLRNIIYSIDIGGLSTCLTTIVSLYIPVAILIYQEFKDKPSSNEFEWEKTVLLQEVIKGGQILIAVISSSVAITFWNYPTVWVKVSLLAFFVAGILILIKNLANLFKWFMSNKVGRAIHGNYRQEQKMAFLNSLDPNTTLDVWNNLFGSIELENAYLKDYLKVFLKKFTDADDSHMWQYKLCLTRNMERLYYWGPDFQETIMDFASDAYLGLDKNLRRINLYKRAIVKNLVKLLVKNKESTYFLLTRTFDTKLADLEDNLVLESVKKFSFDVLQEVLSVYGKIPEKNDCYVLELFPLDKWNISSITTSQDKKANAKATGLFIAYLSIMPAYTRSKAGDINEERSRFLDEIVFGMHVQNISLKVVKIINLYFFGHSTFILYDGEDKYHASIRAFIDNDYHFLLMDSVSCSISCDYDPEISDKQRVEKIMEAFRVKEGQCNRETLRLLTYTYEFLLDNTEMKTTKKALSEYNLDDKKYKYKTNIAVVKNNLEDLTMVIDKVINYQKSLGKNKKK